MVIHEIPPLVAGPGLVVRADDPSARRSRCETLYSVVRALEVVGEATKRLPSSVREKDPTVPWKEMAGMRDKLIHAYETVDVELVLKTVRERIPEVEPRVRALLEQLKTKPPR